MKITLREGQDIQVHADLNTPFEGRVTITVRVVDIGKDKVTLEALHIVGTGTFTAEVL